MKRVLALFLVVLAACEPARAAGEPFDAGKERTWWFLNRGAFPGALDRIENGNVYIRMSDGVTRSFYPGGAEGMTASFLQRAAARLPASPSRPAVVPGQGALIDLSAAGLGTGPLAKWSNVGRLGGAFVTMNQPPHVAQVQGRKAVLFEHAPWLTPLEFQTMVSDFYMPESAIGGDTLTVVAWLCNLGAAVDRETFLCWGEKDCGELDTPDFSYGCYDAMQWYDEKMAIPQSRFPRLETWHQFAFVVEPSDKDKNRRQLTLYVDGERVAGRLVRKPAEKVLANNLAFLGCAWEAWWGHSWATRPARPYTGAIAGIKVFDRALAPAEIRQLDGKPPEGKPAHIEANAASPQPANGAREILPGLQRLAWKPSPDAASQVLHFGTNREDVLKGTAATVKLKNIVEDAYIPIDLKLPKLDAGRTYYWRVEQVTEPKVPGPDDAVWSFTTSEFDLEFDGPVSEPFPKEMKQDGFYSRIMDAGGYPIISAAGNDDIHMRAVRHALRKFLDKRPDIVKALQSSHAASHLGSREHGGWGWSYYVCSCYGSGEAILREGAIMMHEMGHQFQMQGAEVLEPDFRQRLADAFYAGRRERLWIGDYGGGNLWENVAVWASWWINDMTQDEGGTRPREVLRQADPRMYHLLSQYWAGDTLIALDPASGLELAPDGSVSEWRNGGGIEYFRPNIGWRRYARTVGRFTPAAGKPALRTPGGVAAVVFGGSDALTWDQTPWAALDGNRAWSVDLWAWREAAPTREETLVEWGAAGSPAVRLQWGASDTACALPGGASVAWTRKPEAGRWHHLAWVFTGGGLEDGPGTLRLYVDGRLDNTARFKLALPPDSQVTIGRGFMGGLSRVRIHEYDLHPLQVAAIWARESPAFPNEPVSAAGRLLVSLDARILAPVQDAETWPLYPASLEKPWLRSWVNAGTLGGKLHNEARSGQSQPRAEPANGVAAIRFDGKSRMISSFASSAPADGSLELWVCPEGAKASGTVLQWGVWTVPAGTLRAGAWQHVVLTRQAGTETLYVNATRVPSVASVARPAPAAGRFILGGEGDGRSWSNGFRGSVAMVRFHEGVLKPEQLVQCIARSPLIRPSLPEPAPGSEVVIARKPALRWQVGVGAATNRCDLYIGTNAAEIAVADRSSRAYQGIKSPGEFVPPLKPGGRYYWRVDNLGRQGQPRARSAVWDFRAGQGAVFDLDAATLGVGPVTNWVNRGAAGGVFSPLAERALWRPSAALVDGRSAVDFAGRKSLVSSFPAPEPLLGGGSFTLSLWAYYRDEGGLPREQTMLAWGRRPGDRAEFCWGNSEKNGAFIGGPKTEFGFSGPAEKPEPMHHNAPPLDGWRHIAYVYDAASHKLRIYVDGKLNREESVTLSIKPGEPICLGGARTGRLPDSPFGGFLGEVAIADGALSEGELGRLAKGEGAASVGKRWIVRLDAADLKPGVVDAWPNRGTVGGEFVPESEPVAAPKVEAAGGRSAVVFDGQCAALGSDILTPAALTGDHALTVEMWLANPKLADLETILGLAPLVAMKAYPHDESKRAASFNFGAAKNRERELRAGLFTSGQPSRNVGWEGEAPATLPWQHVAWVYSGGYNGTFKVYVGGKLVAEQGLFTLDTAGGHPVVLGAAWNTARGTANKFSGSLGRLKVYDFARTEEEIRQAAEAGR